MTGNDAIQSTAHRYERTEVSWPQKTKHRISLNVSMEKRDIIRGRHSTPDFQCTHSLTNAHYGEWRILGTNTGFGYGTIRLKSGVLCSGRKSMPES